MTDWRMKMERHEIGWLTWREDDARAMLAAIEKAERLAEEARNIVVLWGTREYEDDDIDRLRKATDAMFSAQVRQRLWWLLEHSGKERGHPMRGEFCRACDSKAAVIEAADRIEALEKWLRHANNEHADECATCLAYTQKDAVT